MAFLVSKSLKFIALLLMATPLLRGKKSLQFYPIFREYVEPALPGKRHIRPKPEVRG
jgi:hypothetical protein